LTEVNSGQIGEFLRPRRERLKPAKDALAETASLDVHNRSPGYAQEAA